MSDKKPVSIVTGGSGFIGSHVVDKLVDAGHHVIVMDLKVRPHRSDVEFRDVDISNYSSVLDATGGADYIYHLAAMSNVNHVFERPVYSMELNMMGTVHLLEAARKHAIKRFFFASTVWVYSGCIGDTVTEDTPFYLPKAGHLYSSSKIAAEFFIHDYRHLYKVPFTIFRYGIPYGPRMREELVIPIFLKKAFSGQPITITGDGNQFRDFVYVEDLADAHVTALAPAAEAQVLNLEGQRRVTIREIAETIRSLVGDHVKIEYLPARPGDYAGKMVGRHKAKELMGWEAKVDFQEGMRRTVEWYRKNASWANPARRSSDTAK